MVFPKVDYYWAAGKYHPSGGWFLLVDARTGYFRYNATTLEGGWTTAAQGGGLLDAFKWSEDGETIYQISFTGGTSAISKQVQDEISSEVNLGSRSWMSTMDLHYSET